MYFSGFFNGNTEYGQEELSRYFDNIYESGVSLNSDGKPTLQVQHGKKEVTLTAGYAIVRGYYLYNDSNLNIQVLPDASYSRIDRVVLQLDMMRGHVWPVLKKGTAGSTPAAPSLQRDENIYELSLARIRVLPETLAGVITVTDERTDPSLCGIIRPKNLTEYQAMVSGFQKQWDEWFANQQGQGWRDIKIQSSEPGEAVAGSIWIQTT